MSLMGIIPGWRWEIRMNTGGGCRFETDKMANIGEMIRREHFGERVEIMNRLLRRWSFGDDVGG